jgi:hypothetical protein
VEVLPLILVCSLRTRRSLKRGGTNVLIRKMQMPTVLARRKLCLVEPQRPGQTCHPAHQPRHRRIPGRADDPPPRSAQDSA